MKKEIRFAEEDRVLRLAVTMMILLFIAGGAVVALRMRNLRVDSTAGEKKLEELAKADVNKIDKKIQKLEKKEEKAYEERQNRTNSEKFADCLILGDVICQGLYEYEYLEAGGVSIGQSLSVASPDETGLTAMLEQAIADSPKKIFLVLGRGDAEIGGEDAAAFASGYKNILVSLKSGLPDSTVYVNSIVPASQAALEENQGYVVIDEYNRQLEAVCESEQVVFINQTEFMKDEYYEADGIHMTAAYYSEWISYMAEKAEL